MQKAEQFKQNLPRNIRDLNPELSIVWACCTDGFDNSSMNTSEDLKNKVTWAREKGVKCFFLAANQDAVTTGESYGFSPDQSLTYTASTQHAKMAFRSVSSNMRQASCGERYTFTQLQRDSSQRTPSPPTPQNTPHLRPMQNIRSPPRLRSMQNIRSPPRLRSMQNTISPLHLRLMQNTTSYSPNTQRRAGQSQSRVARRLNFANNTYYPSPIPLTRSPNVVFE